MTILKISNQTQYLMNKHLLLWFSCLIFGLSANAQYNLELGVNLGAANYLGEFGGSSGARQDFIADVNMAQSGYAYGFFVRERASNTFSFCLSFDVIQLHGADSLSTNPARVGRNLSFENIVKEFTFKTEINLYTLYDIGPVRAKQIDFHMYGFTGFTVFLHNPTAKYMGNVYDLQPLKLEGQSSAYSLIEPAIPLGIGLTYTFNRAHRFGAEIGWRITFTDYLDDASKVYADPTVFGSDEIAIALSNRYPELSSTDGLPGSVNYGINPSNGEAMQRGSPAHNDHYLVANFTYSYVLQGAASNFRNKYRRRMYGSKRRRTKMKL